MRYTEPAVSLTVRAATEPFKTKTVQPCIAQHTQMADKELCLKPAVGSVRNTVRTDVMV